MSEQNKKYDMSEKKSGDFFQDASNELKLGFIGIALGAPVQYKKDHTTGLEQMCLMIPNNKDNGFTPCVFTFGINDCIGNSAFNAICKNVGVSDFIFSNDKVSEKNKKLANQSSKKINLKKGTPYPTWVEDKYKEYLKRIETYSPGPVIYNECVDAVENYVNNLKEMYAIDSKAKNQPDSQQAK